MASIHIEQDTEGPWFEVPEALAAEARRALFQACLAFREEPAGDASTRFRLDEDVSRATLLRALEALP